MIEKMVLDEEITHDRGVMERVGETIAKKKCKMNRTN